MSGELVKTEESTLEGMPDDKTLISYLNNLGIGKNLTEDQLNQFLNTARAFQLNPYKREIHPVGYYSKREGRYVLSIITGYEVYIKRAERTGKLNGWESGVKKEGKDAIGWVKIYRKDWEHPFVHEVYFKEVAQYQKDGNLTSFWAKAPRFQLKKVAISQGFRLCFPDELGGMPYTSDELPDDMAGRYSPPPPQEREINPQKNNESQKDQNLVIGKKDGPENSTSNDPEKSAEKPAEDKKKEEQKNYIEKHREELTRKRNELTHYAELNQKYLDKKTIKFFYDIDLRAMKQFYENGQEPFSYIDKKGKLLEQKVQEEQKKELAETGMGNNLGF